MDLLFERKLGENYYAHFKGITEIVKYFQWLYAFRGHCVEIVQTFKSIFNHVSKYEYHMTGQFQRGRDLSCGRWVQSFFL